MEDLNSTTNSSEKVLVYEQELSFDEIMSIAECKKYFAEQALSDEKINDIKNNLVGIVNSVISYYLEGFK